MSKKTAFIFWAIAFSCCVYGLYYFIIGAYWCVPNAEDFALSIAPREEGAFNAVADLLTSYDARYTTNFLHTQNLISWGYPTLFYWLPILCLLALIGSLYFLLSAFVSSRDTTVKIMFWVILFILGYTATMPSLAFSYYYMSSTFTYSYGWVFVLLWVGFYLRSILSDSKQATHTFFGLFFLLLSYGCSELFIIINTALLFIGSITILIYYRSWLRSVYPYFVLAIGAVLFIYFCPSNKMTLERFDTNYSSIFLNFIDHHLYFFKHHLFHPVNLSILVFSASFLPSLNLKTPNNSIAFLLFLSFIAAAFLCVFPYFVGRSISTEFPERIFNVSLFLFLFSAQFLFAAHHRIKLFKKINSPAFQTVTLAVVFLTLLFSENNINLIKQEYATGVLQEVYDKQQAFYGAVEEAHKSGKRPMVVYFENPSTAPKSTYFGPDVQPNRAAADWNVAYEKYFKVDEVRLVGDTVFKQFKR